jgi:hypothetical protein
VVWYVFSSDARSGMLCATILRMQRLERKNGAQKARTRENPQHRRRGAPKHRARPLRRCDPA